ncbi:MAG: amidohydrolase [Eubacteriales bacterium]|nr:amidohydrolase [Eubacteriales bacterium]
MKSFYLLKNALYLNSDYEIQAGDIRLGDGLILELSEKALENMGELEINCENKLVIPALYNCHTHFAMTPMRGYGENLHLLDWLEQKIFPFEALLSEEDVYWSALLGIAELLANGCCSATDMYFLLPAIIRAVKQSGIKANLCNPLAGNTRYQDEKGFTEVLQLLSESQADESGRLKIDAGIHGEYSSTPEGVKSVIDFAREHELAIHLHLSESEEEQAGCLERHGVTPLRYFYELGLFDCPVIAAHAVQLSESDFQLLGELTAAGSEITLVHNPSSNLKLASGFAPLKRWVEAGVNICIATDGPASNNSLNLFSDLHLAACLQKAIQQDPAFFTPEEVLAAVTENGARAQRRSNCAKLLAGYKADLAILDISKPHYYPQDNLLAHLVYSAQGADVTHTFVDGDLLYQNGHYKYFDIDLVKRQVSRLYREKIKTLNKEGQN